MEIDIHTLFRRQNQEHMPSSIGCHLALLWVIDRGSKNICEHVYLVQEWPGMFTVPSFRTLNCQSHLLQRCMSLLSVVNCMSSRKVCVKLSVPI